MAYLEAFLLYLVVVIFIFILFYGVGVLLYMFYAYFKLSYKHGNITFKIYKNHFYALLKAKTFRFLVLAYFATFGFFYINQASDYFGDDRAYPQAKAYKIVSDLVLFHYDFFISNRNLYYKPSGLKYINTYQKVQNYLMQKGFEYIPKDDAERAIWKYEYFYSQYIRAMAAPIDFEKLHKSDLGYILRIGGHPTIYKPQAKGMLIEIESLLDSLMDKPMKDKYYDEVNRYTTTILFSEWWEKFSFLHYTLGVRTVDEQSTMQERETRARWTENNKYLKRLNKLSNHLDITKEKIDNSKQLKKEMKRHKLLYPDLMGLRVKFMSNLTYSDMQHNEISCKNKMLQRYLFSKKEFVQYAKTDRIYKKMNWHENWISKKLSDHNLEDYLLNQFCNIDAKSLEIDGDIFSYEDGITNKTKKIIEGFEDGR